MPDYRANLEKSKNQLLRVLESNETVMRGALSRQLGQIVNEINLLDAGEHWTQASDTKDRICTAEINRIYKTISELK